MKKHGHAPGHRWVIGAIGVTLGGVLLVVFPRMRGISGTMMAAGLFHVVGAVVLLRSGAVFLPSGLMKGISQQRRSGARSVQDRIDFGWHGPLMSTSWLLALALGAMALGLQLAYPAWWLAWFLVAMLGVNFLLGGVYLKTFSRSDWAALPMTDLIRSREDRVLDAGCGAGRTALAVGRVIGNGTVTCLDRFNAGYIRGGGMELLKRNVQFAGLNDCVEIVQGDICAMPFQNASFDAAVSAHAIDHLGEKTEEGLREIHRVLKPGGRFLMLVSVREWTAFGLSALFGLFATSKKQWRDELRRTGFSIVDEGMFNRAWYVLVDKP